MYRRISLAALVAITLASAGCSASSGPPTTQSSAHPASQSTTPQAAPSSLPGTTPVFTDNFQRSETLDEASPMSDSSDPNWWLNSGGRFIIAGGIAQTIQGSLPSTNPWYQEYVREGGESLIGSDHGQHPQNLFRLLYRHPVLNPVQQFYFRIKRVNLSADPERNAWSGVFTMSRYADDGDTLYYAGLRMDGTAVIKKKQAAITTSDHYADPLAEPTIVAGTYNRTTNPNLLPVGRWIGLRSSVSTNSDGSVTIRLWLDLHGAGAWQLVATATDHHAGGVPPITAAGLTGIRADFMDLSFRGYTVSQT